MLTQTLLEELDLRFPERDGIGRRQRTGSVDREDGDLEPIARLHALAEHHAVGHVETLDGRGTWPSDGARQLAVDPDFRIVVHDDRNHGTRARGVEVADLCGDRQSGTEPRHEEVPAAASIEQALWLNRRPRRIV